MRKRIFLIVLTFLTGTFILESCGPVIIYSKPDRPPPPWFYPGRVVNVRYVYFPEYTMYYDLIQGNYWYVENGTWITVKLLPSRFKIINLKKSKRIRINYYGDNIRRYHRENSETKRSRRNN